eukprot:Gb_39779 [translate_table: standard]
MGTPANGSWVKTNKHTSIELPYSAHRIAVKNICRYIWRGEDKMEKKLDDQMGLISADLVAPIVATILGAVLGYLSSLSSSKQGVMHEHKMDRLWRQYGVHAKLAVAMEQSEYSWRFFRSQLDGQDVREFVRRATEEEQWRWIAWHDDFFCGWAERIHDLLTSNADLLFYDKEFPYERVVLILGRYCVHVYTTRLCLKRWKEMGRVSADTLPEPFPLDIVKYIRHSNKCVQNLINKLNKAVKKMESQSVPFLVWEEMEKSGNLLDELPNDMSRW